MLTNSLVAVGTSIAARPPHRSVRALLTHTALTSDGWRRSEHLDRDARYADKAPSGRTSSNSDPSASAFRYGGLLSSTIPKESMPEPPERRAVPRHRVVLVVTTLHTSQPLADLR